MFKWDDPLTTQSVLASTLDILTTCGLTDLSNNTPNSHLAASPASLVVLLLCRAPVCQDPLWGLKHADLMGPPRGHSRLSQASVSPSQLIKAGDAGIHNFAKVSNVCAKFGFSNGKFKSLHLLLDFYSLLIFLDINLRLCLNAILVPTKTNAFIMSADPLLSCLALSNCHRQ